MERLEYRVFGQDLSEQRAALAAALPVLDREDRDDLYLLGGEGRTSFKLRAGAALDLKVHLGNEDGYERWRNAGRCTLPARTDEILARLAQAASLPPIARNRVHDAGSVREAFEQAGFRSVAVHKFRTRFGAGACLGEATRLVVGARTPVWTVAIEGQEIRHLDRLKHGLNLAGLPNLNYPQWLGRLCRLDLAERQQDRGATAP